MISFMDSMVLDRNSESLGISVYGLMSNAGRGISDVLRRRFEGKRIAFICGTGNNGGDGIIAAACCPRSKVVLVRNDFKNPSIIKTLNRMSNIESIDEFDWDCDVIVDCLLGTGIKGEPKQQYVDCISKINEFKGDIVSVDVPSGTGTKSVVMPHLTIALHDVKEGTVSDSIEIVNIGIPSAAIKYVGPGDMLRYPIPDKNSHKGCNGRLLIVGGGPYHGAPALSGMAALRVGTDVVRVATPINCSSIVSSVSPVLTVTSLPGNELGLRHVVSVLDLSRHYDALLIGPGLGVSDDTMKAVNDIVNMCGLPTVIDADGITALRPFKANKETVITPHLAEFKKLGGERNDEESVMSVSKGLASTIVLKGHEDIISDGDRTRVNRTGCSGMTGAGTGDVLSGIIGGLLSKGMSAFDAACLGTYISGKAGEDAFSRKSYGMIATDVIEGIPQVLLEGLR